QSESRRGRRMMVSRQVVILPGLDIVRVSVLAGLKILEPGWVDRTIEGIVFFIGGHTLATKQQQGVVMGMKKRGEIITLTPEEVAARNARLAVLNAQREDDKGRLP